MPFTPSHAAAALLFRKTPLPLAALVAGTVAPDLLYYWPFDSFRHLTHDPLGVVTIDLAIGLAALAAWWWFLRAPSLALVPAIRLRPAPIPSSFAGWLLVLAAIVIGAITHLVWDAFTHPGPVVDALPLLNVEAGPLLVHKWLQHSSSIVGAIVIAVAAWRWMRRSPRAAVRLSVFARIAWVAIAGAFVVSAMVAWMIGIGQGIPPLDPGLVFRTARVCVGCAIAAWMSLAIVWHAQTHSRPTTPVS